MPTLPVRDSRNHQTIQMGKAEFNGKHMITNLRNRASILLRQKKFKLLASCTNSNTQAVLDVGVWAKMPEPHPQENWLEKQPQPARRLFCLGLEPMQAFRDAYPHTICVQGDGRFLPFQNGSMDCVVANAVLEHVGGGEIRRFSSKRSHESQGRLFLSLSPTDFAPWKFIPTSLFCTGCLAGGLYFESWGGPLGRVRKNSTFLPSMPLSNCCRVQGPICAGK